MHSASNVRLSLAVTLWCGFVTNRMQISSNFFQPSGMIIILYSFSQTALQNSDNKTHHGGVKRMGWEIRAFRQKSPFISGTEQDSSWLGHYGSQIGTRRYPSSLCQFRWRNARGPISPIYLHTYVCNSLQTTIKFGMIFHVPEEIPGHPPMSWGGGGTALLMFGTPYNIHQCCLI